MLLQVSSRGSTTLFRQCELLSALSSCFFDRHVCRSFENLSKAARRKQSDGSACRPGALGQAKKGLRYTNAPPRCDPHSEGRQCAPERSPKNPVATLCVPCTDREQIGDSCTLGNTEGVTRAVTMKGKTHRRIIISPSPRTWSLSSKDQLLQSKKTAWASIVLIAIAFRPSVLAKTTELQELRGMQIMP